MRTLIVHKTEAITVRQLFALYDEHRCLRVVETTARDLELKSKRHSYASGRTAGGRPFSRGQIYCILRNPIYIGEIRHKDKTYPGQHPAIINQALWTRVQEKLSRGSQRKRGQSKARQTSTFLLTGKLWDETGDRLTPTSTNKGKRKHRYYVSNRLITGGKDATAWRLSADPLEQKLAHIMADHLEVKAQRAEILNKVSISGAACPNNRAIKLAQMIRDKDRGLIADIILRVQLRAEQAEIQLDAKRLAEALGVTGKDLNPNALTLTTPWQIKKRGVESKIIVGDEVPGPDLTLIRLLTRAHQWVDQMRQGRGLKAIADQASVTPAYIRSRSKLALLSPKIQGAIIGGNLDPRFTTHYILALKIPMDWTAQEALFFKS